jgi:hypothetical protein
VALGALVVGMPDSGFFLDYEDPVRKFHTGLKWVFEESHSASGVDQVIIIIIIIISMLMPAPMIVLHN